MRSLSLGGGHAEHIDVPFVAECSTGTFSLKLNQLRASVWATFHCTKTAPGWSLRAELTYSWKDLNIKCSLILYSFSKITVIGSCLGFMDSVTMVCNQIRSIRLVIPPMKWVLNQKGTWIVTHAAFLLIGLSCHACHYCSQGVHNLLSLSMTFLPSNLFSTF